MYDRILVPTDGSDGASAALEEALVLAERFDAAVHSLYVVDATAVPPDQGYPEIVETLDRAGEETTAAAVERARERGVGAEPAIVHGTPHRSILEYVTDNDVDLVVMGTHGRTGVARYLLGSVTERVVRTADVPVLTVQATNER